MPRLKKELLIITLVLVIITASLPFAVAIRINKLEEREGRKCLPIHSSLSDSKQKITIVSSNNRTAVVLSPFEFREPLNPCNEIVYRLENSGYNVVYKKNREVTLSFVENNLSANIIFYVGHGGYIDVDDDGKSDGLFIATCEQWTENTEEKYAYEHNNELIAKMKVGGPVIGFNAELITSFYEEDSFPEDSLVYMAACESASDKGMANAFISVGAEAYIGWENSPFLWIDNRASRMAFYLLSHGRTVEETCKIIGYGGLLNLLPLVAPAKLKWYGNGDLRIVSDNNQFRIHTKLT